MSADQLDRMAAEFAFAVDSVSDRSHTTDDDGFDPPPFESLPVVPLDGRHPLWSRHRDLWAPWLEMLPLGQVVIEGASSFWTKVDRNLWESGSNRVSTITLLMLGRTFQICNGDVS